MEFGSSESYYFVRRILVPMMRVSATALDNLSVGAF